MAKRMQRDTFGQWIQKGTMRFLLRAFNKTGACFQPVASVD